MKGRVRSITESHWWCLQIPYCSTNVDFSHVPTFLQQNKSGIVREERFNDTVNLGSTFTEDVRVHREVLQLPKHRQFTKTKSLLLADVQKKFKSPDEVTAFGLRPPEFSFRN